MQNANPSHASGYREVPADFSVAVLGASLPSGEINIVLRRSERGGESTVAGRGFRFKREKIARLVEKQMGKADGLDVTLDELQAAEYKSGIPLEPTAARLFRRYRGLRDAIHEFAASSGPLKPKKSKRSKPPAEPIPMTVSNFVVPYGRGKAEIIRETLSVLTDEFREKEKQKKEKNENIVAFLRGIHCELEKVTGRKIRWSVIPDAKTVEIILTGHSDSLQSWVNSPPPDLGEQLRTLGEVAGLIDVWTRLGELVLIYGKPTRFFEKYAPDLTPALFDPDRLDARVGRADTLARCFFVWGPSALLNPVVREAWDRVAKRGAAFQDVITVMTGRTSYIEGRRRGRRGRSPKTVAEDRLREKLVQAIIGLGGGGRPPDSNKRSRGWAALVKEEGCGASVKPLVGKGISYKKAYEIVGKCRRVSASAIRKSCSLFSD